MGRVFFTADHHFGHANILKYEGGRRFQSVEQMDEYLVEQWNGTVGHDDLVYCLGDLSMKQAVLENILPRLRGEKILVVGNHDPYFKRLTCAMPRMHKEAREDAIRAGFSAVHLQMDIEIEGIGKVRLSHFPYWPNNVEGEPKYNLRNKANRPFQGDEALLLHGHIHSQWLLKKQDGMTPMLNVGIDAWNLRPVSEAEIVGKFSPSLACSAEVI